MSDKPKSEEGVTERDSMASIASVFTPESASTPATSKAVEHPADRKVGKFYCEILN